MKPNFEKNNIPVIFSADNNYVDYLIVTIKSLICNSSNKYNYDIYVLNDDIEEHSKLVVKQLEQSNVKITFVDMNLLYNNIDKSIFYLRNYFTISTYNRFFIPRLFKNFDKIIYIDCDTIILGDVAELYYHNLNNNVAAATKDIYIMCEVALNNKNIVNYFENKLKLKNKNNYFQAGLLVLDIKKLTLMDFESKCIDTLKKIKTPLFVDQDILNIVLENHVEFLNVEWDMLLRLYFKYKNYNEILSKLMVEEYNKGFKHPKMVHFTGNIKPWKSLQTPKAYLFWKYAIRTPVFWKLIKEPVRDFIFKSTKNLRLLKLVYFG